MHGVNIECATAAASASSLPSEITRARSVNFKLVENNFEKVHRQWTVDSSDLEVATNIILWH